MGEGHFRGTQRSRIECRVEVRRLEGGGAPFVAFTSDVSLGGLCLAGCGSLRRGERVEMALTCPSRWEPVVVRAEVCWLRESGAGGGEAGFRFVDASDASSAALAELVAALAFDR